MQDLTKTITYHYIKDDGIFETETDRDNFIKYCEYMMFSNYDEPHPIPDEDCRIYFRGLYKVVEMRYEEDILEGLYIKKKEEDQKENDDNKLYNDYFTSEEYYKELYSQHYFTSKTN